MDTEVVQPTSGLRGDDGPWQGIAELLVGTSRPGSFSAMRTVPADRLQIEVRGLGPLRLPVPQVQSRQLCAIAHPARFGKGEATLLDRAVRDTWEVPKSRVKIDARNWNATLLPILERFRREMGLPEGARLRPEFHSMLVYAPGQFFVPHQDSEKDDAMVGSLVVMIPSSFEGGALEVRHGGDVKTYRGSKTAISLVAFYSDCRHQISRVRSGYRIVLTYNLLLDSRSIGEHANADVHPAQLQALATAVREHFRGAKRRRLVYLLDHEYTSRGLSWGRLKGPDAERGAMLQAAAHQADCEAVLALADVHETWSAYDAWERHRHGRPHYRSWDDDFDLDDEAANTVDEEYELEELIESEVTLDSWLDPSGRIDKVALPVSDLDVCASKPSGDLHPYESQYEGYMGNWGNTLDRWYHRGAIVLWPNDLSLAARAEATPARALDVLIRQVCNGALTGALAAAATLAPVWEQTVTRTEVTGLLRKALRAASALEDPGVAAMLLRPFRLEQLRLGDAKALSALVERYGEAWTGDLVASWSVRRGWHWSGSGREQFVASLPAFCAALVACGDSGSILATRLVRVSWAWAAGELESARNDDAPSRRGVALTATGKPFAAVLASASLLGDVEVLDGAVGALSEEAVLPCSLATLRQVPRSTWSSNGLDIVASRCAATLEDLLSRPIRDRDNWSIDTPIRCCDWCDVLVEFAADPRRCVYEWPLRKEGRGHIHAKIEGSELPIRHETRRKGSPYTLVLTKTSALFDREEDERRQAEADLAWILSIEKESSR